MTRVVMIGVDGLDADLLRVYGPSLPHLRRMMLESPFLEMQSSFPPDAGPCWTSVYTGLNPARHGVTRCPKMDMRGKEHGVDQVRVPQGETFWDKASNAGKQVCVVNPMVTDPQWSVNGMMLARPSQAAQKQEGGTCVPGLLREDGTEENFPALAPVLARTSMRQIDTFCHDLYDLTKEQVEVALKLFTHERWDIFFLQLEALEYIQHMLWRYNDHGDPTYPGYNKHASHILDFYHLIDFVIGRFRAEMDEDCILMVLSGHGHGRSCVYHFNVNEWLRQQGWLTPVAKVKRACNSTYVARRIERRSLRWLSNMHLQEAVPAIHPSLADSPVYPAINEVIDHEKTFAHFSEISGTGCFGGITLNRTSIEEAGESYESVRQAIIERMQQLSMRDRPVVHRVQRREDVYQGPYLEQYPDLLFELRSEFGTGSDLYVPLITRNLHHHLLSGDHRMSGVLLLGNIPERLRFSDDILQPSVMDVCPTVLQLLDIACEDRDGQALTLPSPVKQLI